MEEFLKVTMCAPVVQGYGLTETCAGSFISVPDLHVGVPSPACYSAGLEGPLRGVTAAASRLCSEVPDEACSGVQEMAGTVGPPLPCTAFRLEAVPEMNYDPCALSCLLHRMALIIDHV